MSNQSSYFSSLNGINALGLSFDRVTTTVTITMRIIITLKIKITITIKIIIITIKNTNNIEGILPGVRKIEEVTFKRKENWSRGNTFPAFSR